MADNQKFAPGAVRDKIAAHLRKVGMALPASSIASGAGLTRIQVRDSLVNNAKIFTVWGEGKADRERLWWLTNEKQPVATTRVMDDENHSPDAPAAVADSIQTDTVESVSLVSDVDVGQAPFLIIHGELDDLQKKLTGPSAPELSPEQRDLWLALVARLADMTTGTVSAELRDLHGFLLVLIPSL